MAKKKAGEPRWLVFEEQNYTKPPEAYELTATKHWSMLTLKHQAAAYAAKHHIHLTQVMIRWYEEAPGNDG